VTSNVDKVAGEDKGCTKAQDVWSWVRSIYRSFIPDKRIIGEWRVNLHENLMTQSSYGVGSIEI
jgi:hypothetical protein